MPIVISRAPSTSTSSDPVRQRSWPPSREPGSRRRCPPPLSAFPSALTVSSSLPPSPSRGRTGHACARRRHKATSVRDRAQGACHGHCACRGATSEGESARSNWRGARRRQRQRRRRMADSSQLRRFGLVPEARSLGDGALRAAGSRELGPSERLGVKVPRTREREEREL